MDSSEKQPTDSRPRKVRAFFGRSTGYGAYLEKRFGIEVRAHITRSLLGEVTGSSILDVGCGDGTLSLQYLGNGNRLTLLDLSPEMLGAAKRNTPQGLQGGVEYLNIDFRNYKPDRSFDVVLCIGVLAHFESAELLVGKLSSVLGPGGRCLIQLTDPDSAIAKLNQLYYHAHDALRGSRYHYALQRVSLAHLRRVCLLGGLNVARQCRYSFLLPGMGRLPDRFLIRHQLRTMESRLLSRFGSEVILLLSKT